MPAKKKKGKIKNESINIVVHQDMTGRLANKLFQAAALISIREDMLKQGLKAPTLWLPMKESMYKRDYTKYFPGFKDSCMYPNMTKIMDLETFETFEYSKLPDVTESIQYRGYFQDYRYFGHNIKTVVKELFSHYKTDSAPDSKESTVGIHVRRGDYIKMSPQFYGLSLSYYSLAMKRFPDSKFIVFSDDTDWCLNSPLFKGKNITVSDKKLSDIETLLLMSKCDNFIISNSCYALWAAYLITQRNRSATICYPDKWFGFLYSGRDHKGLIPPNNFVKVTDNGDRLQLHEYEHFFHCRQKYDFIAEAGRKYKEDEEFGVEMCLLLGMACYKMDEFKTGITYYRQILQFAERGQFLRKIKVFGKTIENDIKFYLELVPETAEIKEKLNKFILDLE